MIKNLILFPFGGNSREILLSILEINKLKKTWKVKGFIDDNKALWGSKFLNVPVLGGSELLKDFKNSYFLAVIGNPQTYHSRDRIITKLNIPVKRFATIIDPSCRISPDAETGVNTVIMPNVIVSAGVKIGNHCIILPNTVIAHDVKISDYCIIGSNVTISGYCTISSNCYIGSGASIRERITIGQKALVGLGTNIIADVPARTVMVGNPGRKLKTI